jgi:hypothetical protein
LTTRIAHAVESGSFQSLSFVARLKHKWQTLSHLASFALLQEKTRSRSLDQIELVKNLLTRLQISHVLDELVEALELRGDFLDKCVHIYVTVQRDNIIFQHCAGPRHAAAGRLCAR